MIKSTSSSLRNGEQRLYRCGIATTQEAYDEAIQPLLPPRPCSSNALRSALPGGQPHFTEKLTGACHHLGELLIRVYVGHFKLQPAPQSRLIPISGAYVRELYTFPGVAENLVNMQHIKGH